MCENPRPFFIGDPVARNRARLQREFELDIQDLTHDGRGVGRVEGKAVFVSGALPGERVRAKQTGRRINIEAAEAEDERRSNALAKFAVRTEKRSLLDNALVLARSEPGVAMRPDLLDADPWLFGTRNGVIDLRTGEFREARREDYITKLAGVEYEPRAGLAGVFDRVVLPRGIRRAFESTFAALEEQLRSG